jgi:hypothetical protein
MNSQDTLQVHTYFLVPRRVRVFSMQQDVRQTHLCAFYTELTSYSLMRQAVRRAGFRL